MVQYYFRNAEGAKIGPVGAEEFQQLRDAGDIEDRTMVWHSGMIDWEPYVAVQARQELAKTPQPRPHRTAAPATAPATPSAAGGPRLACGTCGQDWPEALLSMESGRPMCGNCQRLKKEKEQSGRMSNAAGVGGWGAWLIKCACGLVVISALIFLRLHLLEGEKAEKAAQKAKLAQKGAR